MTLHSTAQVRANLSSDGQQRWTAWEDIILVEATGQPTPANLREFEKWFQDYARGYPHGVGLIIALRSDIPPPDDQAKRAVHTLLGNIESKLRVLGYLIETPGFGAATMRAAIAGLNLINRRSYPQVTARSVQEMLAAMIPKLHEGATRAATLPVVNAAIARARAQPAKGP